MGSRGSLWSLGAGTRRSLALLWTALLLFSLVAQTISIAMPAPVLGVHDEDLFELDGNVAASTADDWSKVYAGTSGASSTFFQDDPVDDDDDQTFTGGDTKDDEPFSKWLWKYFKTSQAKNDITHAFAASYTAGNGDLITYFGLSKWEADGNNYAGFWFLRDGVTPTGDGKAPGSPFDGTHQVGDILVLANYTNGGAVADFDIFRWVGTGGNANAAGTLQIVDSGVPCTGGLNDDDACGAANGSNVVTPWSYQGRDSNGNPIAPNTMGPGTFFEGGINLTALGLDDGCYSSFIAETRASQSVDATLSDFVYGSFSLCSAPDITTQVKQDGQSLGSLGKINVGESVVDYAEVSGDKGTATGTLEFYVCGPNAGGAPDCSTGGTKVGATKTLSGGAATSDAFTPSSTGYYCFRAEYTPAEGSKYLATSHTNKTTECFQVIPAHVTITKTAGRTPVSAGSGVTFTLSWGNTGDGKATGVVVTDELPGNAGLDWSISSFTGSGSICAISGPVGSEVLTCNVGEIPGNTAEHGSVTVYSDTTAATCGTVDNTGAITSGNDGSDSDDASITVQCPDVRVIKTPDGGDLNAGDTATFSITVENLGPGSARNVALSDELPSGQTWTLGTVTGDTTGVTCGITGEAGDQTLACADDAMASGDTFTVTVTATLDATDCGTIDNTATVSATNEPASANGNNSDDGSIDVLCALIDIEKTAGSETVNAGDEISFTVTVTNNGLGTAYGVEASDPLPAGFAWAIETPVTGWSIVGDELVFSAASMAPAATSSVTIVADTTAEDCGVVNNTASVTTSNDGSDSDGASVTIQCPDVTVEKTAVETPVNAGDGVAFDIVVTNLGPGTAYDVTLTDALPDGIAWSEDSEACEITGTGADQVLTCDFGTLAKDETASVRISGDADAADCGNVYNVAQVDASNEAEDDVANNVDDATVVVLCPDVSVTKTAAASPVNAGDNIAFDIVVTNLGPGTAYAVTLEDALPDGVDWSEDSEACEITGTGADQVLSCDFGSLEKDASASVTVSGTTDAADCGTIPNTATVAAGNEPREATGNNSDDADVVVNCPDVTVVKTADPERVNAGDAIAFDIVVSNAGPGTAYDVTLEDALPDGIAWSEDSDACQITGTGADQVLTCDFGDLAPQASRSVTVSGETDAADCGTVPNTASVAAANEPKSATGNNSDDASVVVDCPEISLTKTADDPEVLAGTGIGFVIEVTNNGDGAAYGVTVTDTLPTDAGTAWTIDAAGSDEGWTIDGGVLSWGPGTLGAGESIRVHIVSPTTAATCGDVDNSAAVTTTNDGSDDDDSTVAVYCPAVSIVKTAGSAADGEELVTTPGDVTFTYVVTNTGTIDLVNVVVVDDNATPADTSDDVTLDCPKDALAAGESMTCTATLPVDFGVRTNVAEVTANPSIDEETEVSDDDDAVVRVPDLGIKKSFTGNTGGTTPLGDPQAKAEDVLTYTLAYDLTDGPVTNGVITDVIPSGLEYVDGTATGNGEFSFASWDPATRTLRWTAPSVTADGTVTYQVRVATDAAELPQPLINVATIDSDETNPDDDQAKVYVAPPPQAETATPHITLPPTNTVDQQPSQPGPNLLLVLIGLAGVMLAVGYMTPAPVRARRRRDRDR